jgi:hypothetical protein
MSKYKYYVNGVLQKVIPQRPSQTQTLKITNKSIIGRDAIKSVSNVKVDNKVIIP